MVIIQKESKIELLGSKVCPSLGNKINLRERRSNKQKSFVDVRLRHANEALKFENVQFQLCYGSPTTIPSNGKLLLLLLLCLF